MATAQIAAERYVNVMNSGNINELVEFIAPDFDQIFYGFPAVQGLEEAKAYVTMLRTAYPDLEQSIDDILADDEKVAFRGTLRGTHLGQLRDMPPTGNRIEIPYLTFSEVVDGKLTRIWIALDKVEYLQQLGINPYGD